MLTNDVSHINDIRIDRIFLLQRWKRIVTRINASINILNTRHKKQMSRVNVIGFRKNSPAIKDLLLEPDAACPARAKIPSRKNSLPVISTSYPSESLLSEDEVPDAIHITYINDVNILRIHEAICKRFSYEKNMVPIYAGRILKLTRAINVAIGINKKRCLLEERAELHAKINDVMTSRIWNSYISAAKEYLELYSSVMTNKSKGMIHIGKRDESDGDKKNTKIRLKIIDEYVKIASDYISINISRIEILAAACPNCGIQLKNFEIDDDTGVCICPGCNWFRENLAKSSYSRDSGKTNSNGKNDYEDRENFYKAAIRFACMQHKVFHAKLEADLDEYFIAIGIGRAAKSELDH